MTTIDDLSIDEILELSREHNALSQENMTNFHGQMRTAFFAGFHLALRKLDMMNKVILWDPTIESYYPLRFGTWSQVYNPLFFPPAQELQHVLFSWDDVHKLQDIMDSGVIKEPEIYSSDSSTEQGNKVLAYSLRIKAYFYMQKQNEPNDSITIDPTGVRRVQ